MIAKTESVFKCLSSTIFARETRAFSSEYLLPNPVPGRRKNVIWNRFRPIKCIFEKVSWETKKTGANLPVSMYNKSDLPRCLWRASLRKERCIMNPITFPGLGITVQIDRVAFSIGSKPVYWYGIIIACGFLLAAGFAAHIAPKYGLTKDNVTDMLLFGLPLGIIGARIYYVIFYFSLYQNADGSVNWGEVVAIWDGGLAIYGGIIAAVTVVVVFSLVKKLSIGAFLDIGAFGLLIGQAIGRWGNFINQEAYGAEATLPWRMGLMVNGEYIYVHPTFLYESLWNLVGLLLLWQIARRWRKYDGQIFTMYVAWYGLGRFWIEGLRTDSLYFFGLTFFGTPIRTSQALAAISFLVAVIVLVYQLKFRTHSPEALFVNRRAAETAEAPAEAQPAAAPAAAMEPTEPEPEAPAAQTETTQDTTEETEKEKK